MFCFLTVRITKIVFPSETKLCLYAQLRTFGDHNTIGRITGEWLDLPPGCFTSNLVYGVNYPKELNYNIKIGVSILFHKVLILSKILSVSKHLHFTASR